MHLKTTRFLLSLLVCIATIPNTLALDFRLLIPHPDISEVFFENETGEQRINFVNGRLSSTYSIPDDYQPRFYLKKQNPGGKPIHVSLPTPTVPEGADSLIFIYQPNTDKKAIKKQMMTFDVSKDKRRPDSFYLINASGYRLIGQVNGEQFTVSSELGANETVYFEPQVIQRSGRKDKIVVMAEMAIHESGEWIKINSLNQFLFWSEGTSKVFVLVRDPGRQLDHDLNLMRIN